MSFQRAMTLWMHGERRPAALFAASLVTVLLAVPGLAAAGEKEPPPKKPPPPPSCPETYNPAHKPPPSEFDGVPGGWSTDPGTTNQSTPQNPDGFFTVLSADEGDVALFDSCNGFGGPEDPIVIVSSGTNIKYTEANGKEPGFKPMAGNNGQNGANSDFISIHVWGQGDLLVCDAEDFSACTCCYVPPPPFTPAQ